MKKIPFLFLLFVLLSGNLHAQEKMSLEAVLAGIKSNDEKIKSIEANYSSFLIDDDNREFSPNRQWGKSGEKEYLVAKRYYRNKDNPDKLDLLDEEFRFDGNKMTTLNTVHYPNAPSIIGGLIRQPNGDEFWTPLTPWHFLGGGLTNKRVLLSKVLEESQNLKLDKFDGNIASLSCNYFRCSIAGNGQYPEFLTVDIDVNKGFRAIKIESFRIINIYNLKVLHAQYSDIILKKIDDTYIPASGVYTVYSVKEYKPKGDLSLEKILNMPLEERKDNVEPILKPVGIGREKMIINDIAYNKGIDSGKFVVKFPAGTAVYDEFSQTGYKVGAATEKSQPKPESADREK